MSDTNFLSGQSSIWIQPDGPNTEPKYLGCHGVGDITEPLGDKTLLYCPDPAAVSKYKVKNSFRGEPGAVTTTIETDVRKTADYLESLGLCGVPIYIHKVLAGRRDTFTNFDRTFILYPAEVTQRTVGAVAARDPGSEAESTQGFEVSADTLIRGFKSAISRMAIVETSDISGIAMCGEDRCESGVVAGQKLNDYIYLSTKVMAGSAVTPADIRVSTKGSSFVTTGLHPFAAGESIAGIVCFKIGRDTTRILVSRGVTDAGAPAEIAYSDNSGASWTNVNVGSTNAEFMLNAHGLFAFDRYHIWFGSNLGRIYFSADGGESWDTQENAVLSATAIAAIGFADSDSGFALYIGGECAKTVNGSADDAVWSLATTVAVAGQLDLAVISPFFLWAVGANGRYYSHDAGVTWSRRDAFATGCIDFLNELIGVSGGTGASATIRFTVNGGYDWEIMPTVANAGFLDVKILTPSLGYIVGAAQGGSGFVGMILPQV